MRRDITRRLTRLFLLCDYEVNVLVLNLLLRLNDSLNTFLLKNSQAHFKQFQLRFQLFEQLFVLEYRMEFLFARQIRLGFHPRNPVDKSVH